MVLTGETEVLGEKKTCPAAILSPRLSYELAWYRTLVSSVRRQRLTP